MSAEPERCLRVEAATPIRPDQVRIYSRRVEGRSPGLIEPGIGVPGVSARRRRRDRIAARAPEPGQGRAPAAAQTWAALFGPPVAGEHALLVAVDAEDARRGRRSRRSSRPARRRRRRCGRRRGGTSRAARSGTPRSTASACTLCRPAHGVGAVLGDDDRLAVLRRPGVELGLERLARRRPGRPVDRTSRSSG